ncbi:hypothetical protein PVA45_00300 [Entomospira entomophila]|uniref:Uncharacterized protein n=1 Tax=Entomospira entomophila TaxID=2719988 RepID=A0A968KT64_9SPIO|nr:hypothetical protein [Entomospira entomophilus]NIZ39961.1 hypothetical protein [Entomospira entomophilus]WDI35522.1 hypothetical protein PVA45_00300 [Entomospira entomophilus]
MSSYFFSLGYMIVFFLLFQLSRKQETSLRESLKKYGVSISLEPESKFVFWWRVAKEDKKSIKEILHTHTDLKLQSYRFNGLLLIIYAMFIYAISTWIPFLHQIVTK